MPPILLGVVSAFFFSFVYTLNRFMEVGGGSWLWSASLRYIFLVPILLPIVHYRGNLKQVFTAIKKKPKEWAVWSFVGFVVFYVGLSIGSSYSPAWLSAATWQVTLIAGILMTPFFYQEVQTPNGVKRVRQELPLRGLAISSIIIVGVIVVQMEQASVLGVREMLMGMVPIVIGAIAYPLGNRKMMEVCEGELDAFQRVLGMTIVTLPWWFLLAGAAYLKEGAPSGQQVAGCLAVTILVALIATVLFFKATDLVQHDMEKLAAVEATQSCEIVFALAGEMVILGGTFPSLQSIVGMVLVILGMVIYSVVTNSQRKKKTKEAALADFIGLEK